ncbi:MAG TPA: APC family permease [Acidimicrobiales bacterium]|nr:APC family permease [Acidimicrobiales bacterium]
MKKRGVVVVHLDASLAEQGEGADKGLKGGALGFVSSVVVGVASTAPAYSLAATLGFVVIAINGLQAPIITIIAFVPMLFISYGYKALNSADPDCGTTFTWATRAFGPKSGWWGGWGIVVADILVMASLAQVAADYLFQLFGAYGLSTNPNSGWVLLVGIGWIVAMTAICYVGIEISANFQKVLLGIEVTMLLVLSIVALVKVGNGTAPVGHLTPSWTWFNPFDVPDIESFMVGFTLMLFIYWGWDTAVSVNEETKERDKIPGRAAVTSTVILLATYALVIMSTQSYAGIGTKGIGLQNPNHNGDVLTVLGTSIFGTSGFGTFLTKLLVLMVLSSAAASTQTTILPTARTTLSMAVFKAIPSAFSKIHKRFLTPTVSTVTMGAVSIALYVGMNYLSNGNAVIGDSVSALGVWIAFYYGLTGLSCAWYFRSTLRESPRNLWLRGILPLAGWLMLWTAMFWAFWYYWHPTNCYTSWNMPITHWQIGGVFLLDFGAVIIGIVLMVIYARLRPAYFRGEVLNRDTPTRVPQDLGTPVGLFGIEPFDGDGTAESDTTDKEPTEAG